MLPVNASLDHGLGVGPANGADPVADPAEGDPTGAADSSSASLPLNTTRFEPAIEPVVSPPKPPGVSWGGLTKDSLTFLVVMQGFRCATENGTRAAFGVNPFIKGYIHAVENMHGFSDGDQFYVNYIGHPMQGAVSDSFGRTTTVPIKTFTSAATGDIGKRSCAVPPSLTFSVCSSRSVLSAKHQSATCSPTTQRKALSIMW